MKKKKYILIYDFLRIMLAVPGPNEKQKIHKLYEKLHICISIKHFISQ